MAVIGAGSAFEPNGSDLRAMIEAGEDVVARLRARADDIEGDVRALKRLRLDPGAVLRRQTHVALAATLAAAGAALAVVAAGYGSF